MSDAPKPTAPKNANKRKGSGFFTGAGLHLKRAMSVDVAAGEHLPDERSLLSGGLGKGSAPLARLMLWRRSYLYVGLLALVPALVLETISTIIALADPNLGGMPIDKGNLGILFGLRFVVLCLNVTLAVGLFLAFKRWTDWERSRRVLLWTWILSFLAPFIVALFPMRALGAGQAALIWGLIGALECVVQLAPKAVSLIPGVLRAAVTTKALFPGATAPGWIVTMAAPIFLLLLFVVLLIPYQLSGSPFIVLAVLAFLAAPVALWRSGKLLAQPLDHAPALESIKRTRLMSVLLNGAGTVFLVIGLLAGGLQFDVFDVLKLVVSIGANVIVLSVVAMALMTRTLARAHVERLAIAEHPASLAHLEAMSAFAQATGVDAPAAEPQTRGAAAPVDEQP